MIASAALLRDLQKRVTLLEEDLRRRCDTEPQVNAPLQAQYDSARASQRTAETFNAWRDEQLTQIAVAWVLACVFVRFLEDNQLLDTPFLAGPDAARMNRARDEQELFFKQHPTASERDYLLHVFDAVGQLPGMRDFFDRRHNPLWLAGPTGDALAGLLDFWRKTNPDTGALIHDFSDPRVSSLSVPGGEGEGRGEVGVQVHQPSTINSSDPTRFLGDLYQDLSEIARKRYALLQTPVFVEEFILDRTLTPAIETFGYREVRMLDMTCGSGHFLLGGFERLFRLWQENEPGENPRVLAQRALDGVYGVDLNPYAVAIAKFRLLLAALQVSGINKLKNAPDFRVQLAVGDSLLHGSRFREFEGRQGVQQTFGGDELFRDELHHFYETEDREELHRILGQQYHVVVGNPPYITVKDKALNQLYRDRFDSCHRKYSLAAPFMERFFDFAIRGEPAMKWDPFAKERDLFGVPVLAGKPSESSQTLEKPDAQPAKTGTPNAPAGFVGMITANSFMKREFGKKLIEECIPKWDLTHVIDTSGAYIPGHGTPTVILFGKHQPPVATTIRTVMGIQNEPNTPVEPERGLVWSAILRQVDQPGSQSEFLSVADTLRASFHNHPWNIGGGGAAELKEQLDDVADDRLQNVVGLIGVFGMTNADDVMLASADSFSRKGVESDVRRPLVVGDALRDWSIAPVENVIFPYAHGVLVEIKTFNGAHRWLWRCRTVMGNRATFGRLTYFQEGRPWWEWHQVALERLGPPLTLTFSYVATNNSFALERGTSVFKQSAPIIKLRTDAAEAGHLALLGVLNSSAACFWMQQVCHNKGRPGANSAAADEKWEQRFEFDSTKLTLFPVPAERPLPLARELDRLAQELKAHAPAAVISDLGFRNSDWGGQPAVRPSGNPKSEILNLKSLLAAARQHWTETLQRMIALQEELDWECYRLYGLLPDASLSFPLCASAPWRLGVESMAPKGTQRREDAKTQGMESGPLSGEPSLTPLRLGERAFEIVMARKMAVGELQTTWFERHGSTPITELPAHWPQPYRELVQRRIALIGSDRNIALIEQPEYKRRWNTEPWDDQLERALRQWLLNRLEGYFFEGERMIENRPHLTPALSPPVGSGEGDPLTDLRASWPAGQKPTLVSTNQLAEVVQVDADFLRLAEIYTGGPGFSVAKLVRELVEDESVPLLPFQRYKESGLRKRRDWERTWDLQRKEDAIEAEVRGQKPEVGARMSALSEEQIKALIKKRQEAEVGVIPVPPKYTSADFKSSTFWRLRGKLDVPKERWISYPGAEREGDPSPVIAWAGWNHLQQAQALAEYYLTAKDTWGWSAERLTLLLAGLADLLPWLMQWHNELNPEYGMGLGDYFAGFLDEECRKNGTTVGGVVEELRFGGLPG